jgi:Protein of unknown function (DUF1353)
MRAPTLLSLIVFSVTAIASAVSAGPLGYFKGDIVAKFLPDGRNMQLENAFSFVDPSGKTWDVPAGAITDGASIPRVLWVAYPPFTGKYRIAAVVHDHYCQSKNESWKATHAVFYDALRAAGVDDATAKTMWAAVYHFGPRWGFGYRSGSRGPGSTAGMSPEQESSYLEDLGAWIAKENPSLDAIASRMETMQRGVPSK